MRKLILLILVTIYSISYSQVIYNTTQTVSSRNYTQDVHIKSGATVKFIGTFKFAKNVRVYVDNTSHIILQNATFERLNTNDAWFGIEMQGYPGTEKPCAGTTSGIFLNSIVRGSFWGIINTKVGLPKQELGAAIHIEGSTFDNFSNATLFNEIHYCGLNSRIINSTFKASSFTYSNNIPNGGYLGSVNILNNKKIITGNTFIQPNDNIKTTMLRLENSVGYIADNTFNINVNTQGIYSMVICDIANFYQCSISYAFNELTIENNIFDNSNFHIEKLSTFPNKYIWIKSNDFKCTNNSNISCVNSLNGDFVSGYFKYNNHIGKSNIAIRNTGSLGFEFYGNSFNNGFITADGVLSGNLTGQQFRCNKFINSTVDDIRVNWAGASIDQGYAYNSTIYPNKNEFANNSSTLKNFNSNKTLKYHYFWPTNCSNLQYPCNVVNTNRLGKSNTDNDQCLTENQSLLSMAPPQDNSIKGSYKTDLLAAIPRFYQKINDMRSAYITPCYYEHIKDNYNPILLQAVDFTDNVFIRGYLDTKISYYQSLPITNELYEDRNLFVSTYINMKREVNDQIERDIYIRVDIDSTITEDSIKSIYRRIPHSSSEFKIANLFLKLKKFDAAIAIYNNIQNLYQLDSLDSLNAQKLKELTILDKTLYNSNRDYSEMTISEINTLRNIANYPNTLAGQSACMILGKVFGECKPELAIYIVENVTVAPEISISPNPSSGIVLIQISNTANIENSYELKIFNSSGVEQYNQPLMGVELENVDLDISSWQNGNYYVSIFVNGSLFTTKTLQKN